MSEYLYIQAVNLRHVIDDTEDLSTRRAGGYMLLELLHSIADQCKSWMQPHSLGASQGFFEIGSVQSLQKIRDAIRDVCAQGVFRHATLKMADTHTANLPGLTAGAAMRALRALVRQRQMQELSFSAVFGPDPVSSEAAEPFGAHVCGFDKRRPAVRYLKNEATWVSLAVDERRQEGRSLRQAFYSRELKHADADAGRGWQARSFTDDLFALTRMAPTEKRRHKPLLEGKMALLYADGNGFGRQADACETPEDMRKWDQNIQCARRRFLLSLLLRLAESTEDETAPLRLETLMWGGDEMLLAVPAWQALDVVRLFFQECQVQALDESALSHSVALVIAHHNAPIGPLHRLAHDLAGQGKVPGQPAADRLHWLVLESFDHAGGDLPDYWQHRGLPLVWPDMALSEQALGSLCTRWARLAQHVPRRNLYRVLDDLRLWSELDANRRRLLGRAYENVHKALEHAGVLAEWKELWGSLGRGDALISPWPDAWPKATAGDAGPTSLGFVAPAHLKIWLTLTELADYLPASDTEGATA